MQIKKGGWQMKQKKYYYSLCKDGLVPTTVLTISTSKNQLDENDSGDLSSTLGKYLASKGICELCESMFEVPCEFDENSFINDLKKLDIDMVKGNF